MTAASSAGVVLLIGWTIFIRATSRSLGAFGVILALAFFGNLFWLVTQWGLIPTNSVTAVTYIVLFVIGAVLGTGMSWSHVRRRLSGQADVDEVEDNLCSPATSPSRAPAASQTYMTTRTRPRTTR